MDYELHTRGTIETNKGTVEDGLYLATPRRSGHRTIRAFCHITLYLFAFLGLAATILETLEATLRTSSQSGPDFVSCTCGDSVAEAISRGCRYDLLASAWLPEQCRDDELSAEFDRSGPGPNGEWIYYTDERGSAILNASEIGNMADFPGWEYWTTLEWHVTHCYFYWLKAWRTKETGLTIEKRYDTEQHIRHCSKLFMRVRGTDLQMINTVQGASLMSGEELISEGNAEVEPR